MDAFDISSSAMSAQRLRLDVIASNLANVNTTRRADGKVGAYRRHNVVFAPILQNQMEGNSAMGHGSFRPAGMGQLGASSISMGPGGIPTIRASISNHNQFDPTGVRVTEVAEDTKTPLHMVFDPSHPDANKDGYVAMPNINPVTEMVDMITATRAYEANVTAVQTAKTFGKAALEI